MYETYGAGTDIITAFFFFIAFIFFISVVAYTLSISNSKSKRYRELLSDMYVVGIIRQLAEKDKVNLNKELIEFDRVIKKSNLRTKGLSEVVEDELKEKVSDTQEKSLSKK